MKIEQLSTNGQNNLNHLTELLQLRLSSKGKTKSLDEHGNTVYIDVDVYSIKTLQSFIELSLSEFNQTPYIYYLTFDHDQIVDTFADIIVEGAALYALSSQALIERGREFSYSNSGVDLTPPSVSEVLNTQFSTLFPIHWEKLKAIKSSFFPIKQ